MPSGAIVEPLLPEQGKRPVAGGRITGMRAVVMDTAVDERIKDGSGVPI
jgi:hypothetical protein